MRGTGVWPRTCPGTAAIGFQETITLQEARAYLEALAVPALWRGAVQIVPGADHAVQADRPELLADLLDAFVHDLP